MSIKYSISQLLLFFYFFNNIALSRMIYTYGGCPPEDVVPRCHYFRRRASRGFCHARLALTQCYSRALSYLSEVLSHITCPILLGVPVWAGPRGHHHLSASRAKGVAMYEYVRVQLLFVTAVLSWFLRPNREVTACFDISM